MSGFNLQPTLISGFTDDVELGEIGEIKKSSEVVMRISVDGGIVAAQGVHWRGIALTRIRRQAVVQRAARAHDADAHRRGLVPRASRPGKSANCQAVPIHYTVLLEPIASTALFFANDVESVRGRFNGEADTTPYSQRRAYLLKDPDGLDLQSLPQLFTNGV